jgi:hypothetical protein
MPGGSTVAHIGLVAAMRSAASIVVVSGFAHRTARLPSSHAAMTLSVWKLCGLHTTPMFTASSSVTSLTLVAARAERRSSTWPCECHVRPGRRYRARHRPVPSAGHRTAVEEPVLHGRDGRDGERLLKLSDSHVRQSKGRDLPFPPQLFQGTDAFGQGYAGVGVVELVEVDLVHLDRPQADLAVRPEDLRPPVYREFVAVAPVPSLGRHQGTGVRLIMRRARDDLLGMGLDARPGPCR